MKIKLLELKRLIARALIESVDEVVLYHGTTSDVVPQILQSGLLLNSDGEVWLTSDRDTAFMNGAMRTWFQKKQYDLEPSVLSIRIQAALLQSRGAGDFTTTKAIAPEHIENVALNEDERESYEFSLKVQRRRKLQNWR